VRGAGPIRAGARHRGGGIIPPMSKITCTSNGPFLAEGVTQVVDAAGKTFDLQGKGTIALCRCATSKNKPFCDGSHKAGFRADDVAPRKT